MWIFLTGCIFIIIFFAYLDTRKPKNFPPGPNWLPIFGSLLAINKLRKNSPLVSIFSNLTKKYGPVIGLKNGQEKQIIVNGHEAIKEFLSNDDLNGRPVGVFYQSRSWGLRRGLLLTDGDFWQEQRRFVLKHLKDFGYGRRNMDEMIQIEAEELIKYITNKMNNGKSTVVPISEMFFISVLNTLWQMISGKRYNLDDGELCEIQSIMLKLIKDLDMVGCLFGYFPILSKIAPKSSGYKAYVKIHMDFLKFFKTELVNHKTSFNAEEPRDFMDIYLKMLNNEEKKYSFSEEQLLVLCMDLFFAGAETTSKTLAFGFLYLLLNPEVQKKAQEEIDRVIGRERMPLFSDRLQMPYNEALMLESIRIFSGWSFGIPHRAVRDTTLQGYFIPKDSVVTANNHTIMLTKDIWDDPEAFRPDRFIINGRISIPETYLPFGFGKHRCMGEVLAKANVFILTTSLLQRFNFSIPDGQPVPSTNVDEGLTPGPMMYRAKVVLRN